MRSLPGLRLTHAPAGALASVLPGAFA